MDVAYNQHASAARRKNRSATSLNHLSLAPLTSKMPLQEDTDTEDPDPVPATPSYLQGKSAPTTPRLLSRSPGRSRGTSTARLSKSKSATHLPHSPAGKPHRHAISPTSKRRNHDVEFRNDSDWLLRAGALISIETRESKGQAWLVSRASSTSLTAQRDDDEEAFEHVLERTTSRGESVLSSRRQSVIGLHDDGDHVSSPPYSRYGSRSHSRVGSRSQVMTPLEGRAVDGYFPAHAGEEDDSGFAGPDFVNLDEALEAGEEFDTTVEDEAYVRRLVKKGNGGMGTWFGSVLGVQLFSVEENSEESDADETEGEADDSEGRQPSRTPSVRRFEGITTSVEEQVPPPNEDEGGWRDAAWLLTVASKVLL
ncbi:hypothetical protein QBC47DRAFT_128911 [Echria macrotheca]|uniref:Uncharacterized protein n=1 Tax=Echria macrotheca TaxID=438768 RepID=A0AAJ0B442_9PEZI|nr:hypothetical protein QBC47DRAFT_128911 [Echria macrotheca]